tara:strand:- start:2227 stop:2694 length:468 start_codon:yes stop_codon:yes gene_type:complete
MIVHIKGGTPSQRKYAESITLFCIKKLMPRMRNLEITINIKRFGKDTACGYALPSDDADVTRPREFDIDVSRSLRLKPLLCTIAHEMVHVKQFARGELYQSSVTAKHRWQGKWIDKNPSYWDLPWEIEANGREVGLFVRWLGKEKLFAKSWAKEK